MTEVDELNIGLLIGVEADFQQVSDNIFAMVSFRQSTKKLFLTTFGVNTALGDPVEVRAIEVNQAVQDWHNSVPLITDKQTVVRVLVEVPDGKASQHIVGRLHGKRNGTVLTASPTLAKNPGNSITAIIDLESRRENRDASLSFLLPPSWRSGTVDLWFDAGTTALKCKNPDGSDADTDADNNCQVTVTFQDEVDPEIVFVLVPYLPIPPP